MSENTSIELTVKAAEKQDAGRGIARVPDAVRRELGILSGETIVIAGDRETVAKVWPARPEVSENVLLVDADTRENAGVTVGDTVLVHAIDIEDADRVTLTLPDTLRVDFGQDSVEIIKRALRDRPIQPSERIHFESFSSEAFVVSETTPDGRVRVTDSTTLKIDSAGTAQQVVSPVGDRPTTEQGGAEKGDTQTAPSPERSDQAEAGRVTYEDIGGLDEELELVREMIELPLDNPQVFAHLGVDPSKGVLLYGPPGTGKTMIAKAVANEVEATFVNINGPEIMSKYKGESEERLREKFEYARDNSPAIVFFDEIDSIAAARDDESDVENRVVGQLLSLMDGLDARGDVVVVGATNRVDTLDPALRRGGRFDREIEIGVPNQQGRREILEVHTRRMPLSDTVDLDQVAAQTHGFVGADLESLTTEAAMTALRRGDPLQGDTNLTSLSVQRGDFDTALSAVEPSAMREYVAESPTTDFDDVGGLQPAKDALTRAVMWPLSYGPLFEAANTSPPTGVLLYGPPGTGKTLLAEAIAGESGVNFIQVAGPELLDRYVGESEKAVREVFDRARQAAPAIIFFDEIDAVATNRGSMGSDSGVGERVVSQLLTELDGLQDHPQLVVVAATNRREAIDEALLRPGRLETHVEVPEPDQNARQEILQVHLDQKPIGQAADVEELARLMQGYSGAEIASVVREAVLHAIEDVVDAVDHPEAANARRDELSVSPEHFQKAISNLEKTGQRSIPE